MFDVIRSTPVIGAKQNKCLQLFLHLALEGSFQELNDTSTRSIRSSPNIFVAQCISFRCWCSWESWDVWSLTAMPKFSIVSDLCRQCTLKIETIFFFYKFTCTFLYIYLPSNKWLLHKYVPRYSLYFIYFS